MDNRDGRVSKREEALLRSLVRESLQLREFAIGDFFGKDGGSSKTAAAKMKLADMFGEDGAEVSFEEAKPLIDALEAAGDRKAADFYAAKLKAHHRPAPGGSGSVRSKDNAHFTERMRQIYGKKSEGAA